MDIAIKYNVKRYKLSKRYYMQLPIRRIVCRHKTMIFLFQSWRKGY
jgi:hypothetical protein